MQLTWYGRQTGGEDRGPNVSMQLSVTFYLSCFLFTWLRIRCVVTLARREESREGTGRVSMIRDVKGYNQTA